MFLYLDYFKIKNKDAKVKRNVKSQSFALGIYE